MAELSSGFVIAAIAFAVLFAERLGGSEELARRLCQLALAAAVSYVVIAGAFAVVGVGEEGLLAARVSADSDSLPDALDRATARIMILYGGGVVVLLTGFGLMQRWNTVPLGLVLAGLFLIVGGSPASSIAQVGELAFRSEEGGSRGMDFLLFGLTMVGAAAIFQYGVRRWEQPEEEGADDDDDLIEN